MSILLCLAACSNSDDDVTTGGGALSYLYLTQNRGYIGGSLIWNPDKGASHLRVGTIVAVRLGKLTERQINLKECSSASDVYVTDSDFTSPDFDSSSNDYTTSFKAAFNGGGSSKTIFDDNPSKAIYGYISVNGIDANYISLAYTRVNPNNSTSTKNFVIQSGKSADLDGDGYDDLKYGEPEIQRTGYSGARWLTFINEKTKPYSSMYFTFTSSAARAGYRATTEAAEQVEEGLYGVNSEGNFIYITYKEKPDNCYDLTHGDYIVSAAPYNSQPTPKYSDDYADDYDPMAEGNKEAFLDYAGKQNVEFKYVEDANYNACYLVTKNADTTADDDLTYVTRDQFATHAVDYDYKPYQFPDQTNGPSDLVKELLDDSETPKAKVAAVKKAFMEANGKTESDPLPAKSADCIAYLNKALVSKSFYDAVVAARIGMSNIDDTASDADAQKVCTDQWASAATDADKKKLARIILDEVYDSSPDAIVEPPCLESAYPTVAANIGSVEELSQDAMRYNDVYPTLYDEDASGRALYTTNEWDKFAEKRKEIRENWKKYHQFTLLALLFPGKGVEMKKAGLDMGIGVKGSITNPSGQFRVDAGIALYMDFDLSAQTIASVASDIGISAPANKNLSEWLKKLFENKKNCKVEGTDVQVQIGPVPLVFGFAIRSGINFDLGNVSPHIAFVGMCGGDAYVDVHYGMKFILPYVHVDTGANGFATKEMFVGIQNAEAVSQEGTKITFEPWINLTPSAGVGKSFLSARVAFPITLGTEFNLAIKPQNITFDKCAFTVKVDFMPYAEVKWKIIKFRLTLTQKTIMNNELVMYDASKNPPLLVPPEWRKRK